LPKSNSKITLIGIVSFSAASGTSSHPSGKLFVTGIDLLDALDDPSGFAALCDLHGAYGQPTPDADKVETALWNIHRVLAEQTPSSLDQIGHERCLPASEMTLWHGARVSELLAQFRHAK
jgi:hypothetical protein